MRKAGNIGVFLGMLPWVIVMLSSTCRAEAHCPWMNAATAAGVLGGNVTVRVTDTNKTSDDAAYTFSRQPPQQADTLQIKVSTMKDPAKEFVQYKQTCGADTNSLKATGNEAVECSVDRQAGLPAQEVIGRVRNRAFVITLSVGGPGVTPDELRKKAEFTAEEVAGSLY